MINEKQLIEDFKNTFSDSVLNQTFGFGKYTLLEAIEEMIERQPKTDWIPCEVEMPKDETLMYWTTHEDGSIIMHGYLKRNGFIYNWEVDDLEKRKRQGKVVAWMPIFKPQPYKKEGAE